MQLVGISTGCQMPLTVPLHIPNGMLMPAVKDVQRDCERVYCEADMLVKHAGISCICCEQRIKALHHWLSVYGDTWGPCIKMAQMGLGHGYVMITFVFVVDANTHLCHNFKVICCTTIEVRTRLSNFGLQFYVDVIIYPCHRSNVGSLNLCY